mmetsp:Transcript_31936/g.70997  ORF Transcript_31936/g.70997 Transcript_31936/m.70997 type:complete len:332 (+) Transcript_31936:232-1227(+)
MKGSGGMDMEEWDGIAGDDADARGPGVAGSETGVSAPADMEKSSSAASKSASDEGRHVMPLPMPIGAGALLSLSVSFCRLWLHSSSNALLPMCTSTESERTLGTVVGAVSRSVRYMDSGGRLGRWLASSSHPEGSVALRGTEEEEEVEEEEEAKVVISEMLSVRPLPSSFTTSSPSASSSSSSSSSSPSFLFILIKYFCACVRICTAVRVLIMLATFFHFLPCTCSAATNISCSWLVQRPCVEWSLFFLAFWSPLKSLHLYSRGGAWKATSSPSLSSSLSTPMSRKLPASWNAPAAARTRRSSWLSMKGLRPVRPERPTDWLSACCKYTYG